MRDLGGKLHHFRDTFYWWRREERLAVGGRSDEEQHLRSLEDAGLMVYQPWHKSHEYALRLPSLPSPQGHREIGLGYRRAGGASVARWLGRNHTGRSVLLCHYCTFRAVGPPSTGAAPALRQRGIAGREASSRRCLIQVRVELRALQRPRKRAAFSCHCMHVPVVSNCSLLGMNPLMRG